MLCFQLSLLILHHSSAFRLVAITLLYSQWTRWSCTRFDCCTTIHRREFKFWCVWVEMHQIPKRLSSSLYGSLVIPTSETLGCSQWTCVQVGCWQKVGYLALTEYQVYNMNLMSNTAASYQMGSGRFEPWLFVNCYRTKSHGSKCPAPTG